jgi:lipid A 3-O-deacylase
VLLGRAKQSGRALNRDINLRFVDLINCQKVNMKLQHIIGIAVVVITATPTPAAPLVNGVAIEHGHSDSSHSDITLTRLSAQKRWNTPLFQGACGRLTGYWELSAGFWDNHSSLATNDHLLDVGLTPVFRCELTGFEKVTPYMEGGVGAHVLSHSSVSEFRKFGSAFEFGDHIGAGAWFGEIGRYDLSYRLQHLSNAGICSPNKGINYHIVRLGIRL